MPELAGVNRPQNRAKQAPADICRLRRQGTNLDAAVEVGAQMREDSVGFRVGLSTGIVKSSRILRSGRRIVAVSKEHDFVAERWNCCPSNQSEFTVEVRCDHPLKGLYGLRNFGAIWTCTGFVPVF